MTIEVTSSYTRGAGNGAATTFRFAFRIFSASDLVVRDIDPGGTITRLRLDAHYSVAIASAGEGGSITLTTAVGVGHTIDIRRLVPLVQGAAIRNQARFAPEIHESAFDRLEAQIQDSRRLQSLSPRLPDSEVPGTDWDTLLSLANRKGKYFGYFNAATGAPELFTSIGGQALSQSIIGQFLYPQTAAEARVKIVNPARPYGHFERYGADGTGASDSHGAITAALSCNDVVYGEPGATYKNATGPIVIKGNKCIFGSLAASMGLSAQAVTIDHAAVRGVCFSATQAEFGSLFIGYMSVIGGNGSFFITSTRPQSEFRAIHMEGPSGYHGSGVQLSNAAQGSWSVVIRKCKWVGPASRTAFKGFEIDVNGGLVELSDCTAIRGDIGVDVFRCEALLLNRINTNQQTAAFSSNSATAGQCGVRLTGADHLRKSVTVLACYLEGSTTQLWSDGHRSLSVLGGFLDDLGNGGSGDIYLRDSHSACTDIRGVDIRTRTRGKHCIENNGISTNIENCTLNAEGGTDAAWLKTTTAVTYSNNNVLAGVLEDASAVAFDRAPALGVWTPTIQGASRMGVQTYREQYGRYWTFGRMVFCEFAVVLTAKDRATAGNLRIAGLPFTSRNTGHAAAGIHLASADNVDLAAGYTQLSGVVDNDARTISMLQSGANVTSAALPAAAIGNTSALRGSFWYVI